MAARKLTDGEAVIVAIIDIIFLLAVLLAVLHII